MINPQELSLSTLPWLPLEASAAFPRQPAIYFAIDSLNKVQYIGRSVDPKTRWCGHHKYDELSAIGGIKVAFLFVESPKSLPEIEELLIAWFNPPLNAANKEFLTTGKFEDLAATKGFYTSAELRSVLARYRGKNVPARTLRWWRNQIGIVPNEDGLYDEDDLKILIQLVRWIAKGGTVSQFIVKLKQKLNCQSA